MRRRDGVVADVLLAAAAFVAGVLQLLHGGFLPSPRTPVGLDTIGLLLVACSAAPILGWRRFPVGAFASTASAAVLLAAIGYPVDLAVGSTLALYLLAASRDGARPWRWPLTVAVAAAFVAYVAALVLARSPVAGVAPMHTGLAWAVAWFAGDRTRLRRQEMVQLRERAARVEREATRDRQLAVAEERARIARDLHDSVAHAISVIAVRAGTARMRFGQDAQRTLGALRDVEELARHTVDEMDVLVGALRDGDDIEAPPGLASLDTLIAHHAATGLRVVVETSGRPVPLGRATDQAVYRILQEALTNAARHGSGGARIALAYEQRSVEFTVTNPVRVGDGMRTGGGHGLIGMRERAELLGGTLRVEHTNGVFQVHGCIPVGGHRS